MAHKYVNDPSFSYTGHKIRLSEILKNTRTSSPPPRIAPGCYIQVRVLWRSGLQDAKVCNFIFGDESNHISAIVFFIDNNQHAKNVCEKLQVNSQWRITNFEVSTTSGGVDRSLLRHQNKRLKLSLSTCDIIKIPQQEEMIATFVTYIPFKFTLFEDIDDVPDTNLIDLIGFVETKEDKTSQNGIKYKVVRVRPFKADEGIKKDIALFGEFQMNAVKKKNAVYAFLNVEVSTFYNQKSLKTGSKTAIFEINSKEVETILPPDYHLGQFPEISAFVKRLFPRRKSSGRSRSSAPIPITVDSILAEFL
ncbi:hypothetical protein Ocin01_19355 [Orchesella cincta]|uniref:Uncharacterized protein n=1 Tax=Orchesella cincta TaxID=48709 RepID=A0A1D2M2X5_ORCCI|nr:hypothetical protein Ocin01_19355 [Orchesella cincta]